jgi:hypothetical protein
MELASSGLVSETWLESKWWSRGKIESGCPFVEIPLESRVYRSKLAEWRHLGKGTGRKGSTDGQKGVFGLVVSNLKDRPGCWYPLHGRRCKRSSLDETNGMQVKEVMRHANGLERGKAHRDRPVPAEQSYIA